MLIIKIIKIKCSNPSRILNEQWCIYSCLQIPPRENWFQYVRRVYTTAINFPSITALSVINGKMAESTRLTFICGNWSNDHRQTTSEKVKVNPFFVNEYQEYLSVEKSMFLCTGRQLYNRYRIQPQRMRL